MDFENQGHSLLFILAFLLNLIPPSVFNPSVLVLGRILQFKKLKLSRSFSLFFWKLEIPARIFFLSFCKSLHGLYFSLFVQTYIRLLPQNRQDPNWEIRKTKNWPKSSGFPNLDPPNLQILEPPGSCRLQDFLILAAGFANLEGPKSGNNWM